MKAMVQVRYGSPDGLELREIDRPAIAADGVLLSVEAASVNAADLHLMKRLPHLIGRLLRMPRSAACGFDVSGVVEAVGEQVTRFRPGDEVFGTALGSFAEYAPTTQERLAAKPANLTFEQSAAIPVAAVTALQGLRDQAGLGPGQKVLVHGAGGGVGTFAVQIARALGARVTASTRAENLTLMRSLGADEVLDYTTEDFTRSGRRWDILFDLGGNLPLARCRSVLVPGGPHVMAGAGKGTRRLVSRLIQAQVRSRLRGERVGTFLARVGHADLVILKGLAEAGRLAPVIDRVHPLGQVPEALRRLAAGRVRGKLVIRVT